MQHAWCKRLIENITDTLPELPSGTFVSLGKVKKEKTFDKQVGGVNSCATT